jgi:soluble lytic murein transglycosylase-like protein
MYDPHKNIAAMTEYLNILHEESGGSIVHTLAYYNAGARNYRAGLGYAHKVLRIAGHNIGARALKKTKKSRRVKKSKSPGGIDAGPVKAYGPANYKFD